MTEVQALVMGREAWDVMRVLLSVMVMALLLFLMMALARAVAEVEMALVMIVLVMMMHGEVREHWMAWMGWFVLLIGGVIMVEGLL